MNPSAVMPQHPLRNGLRAGLTALALGAALTVQAAQAGTPCEERRLALSAVVDGMHMAETTARALDASGAEVVVLARAGQDLRRYGLQWSHIGLAYRLAPPSGPGQLGLWRVVHKLNQCNSNRAGLYRQGLGEFFMDQPWRYAAAYVVLQPALQQQLLPVLLDNEQLSRWHSSAYNMLAYPWSTRYQQSNQWVLETLAGSHGGLDSRGGAQSILRSRGYQPGLLEIDAMTRLGANVGTYHIAFDDQPFGERMAGRIRTVTVESVFAWLQTSQLGGPVRQLP